jgi:hypothetical protein
VGLFGVHVHQHTIGGGSQAAVAGDGIAVIDMRVLADVEMHILTGVQPNLDISFHVDLLDGSELAVESHAQTEKKGTKMMIDPATYIKTRESRTRCR